MTARGYLISLNLKELVFKPNQSDLVLGASMLQSDHPLDLKIKSNFNTTVKCADLTQACRQQLMSDSDLRLSLLQDSQLGLQANLSGPYFVDSNTSASELLHAILSKRQKPQAEEGDHEKD